MTFEFGVVMLGWIMCAAAGACSGGIWRETYTYRHGTVTETRETGRWRLTDTLLAGILIELLGLLLVAGETTYALLK